MNLKPFDFSGNINEIELYQHLCYYHNEANYGISILKTNRREALSLFKDLFHLLRDECNEYDKVRNKKYILYNRLYSQYCDNIRDAYAKPTNVNSYERLGSNLYDVQDYMKYGFNNIFCLNDESNKFDIDKLDDYIGKICCIELSNYDVYVGHVDIKLYDTQSSINESVSVLFLDNWKQIDIENIKSIRIM